MLIWFTIGGNGMLWIGCRFFAYFNQNQFTNNITFCSIIPYTFPLKRNEFRMIFYCLPIFNMFASIFRSFLTIPTSLCQNIHNSFFILIHYNIQIYIFTEHTSTVQCTLYMEMPVKFSNIWYCFKDEWRK